MENSKYHQSKSDQIFSIDMIKGEDNDTKNVISAELSPYQKQEKFMVVMFYNHEMFMSNELIYENLAPIIDVTTLDQGKGLTIEHKKDSYSSYHIYTLTNNLRDIADLSRQREIQCHFEGATMGDDALENAEIYWYIPINSTMLWYDEEYLKNKGFIIPENKKKEGYKSFYRQIKRKYIDEQWIYEDDKGNDTRSFWYQIKELYNPNVSQFEIICEVYRATELPVYKIENGKAVVEGYQITDAVADTPLVFATIFAFGISETSGTKYTLAIERATNALTTTESTELELNIKLFDYNNQQIDILSGEHSVKPDGKGTDFGYSWEWLMQGKEEDKTVIKIDENSNNIIGLNIDNNQYGILKVSVATGIKTEHNMRVVDLSTLYSVPWSTGNCYMSGPTMIIYDSLGKLDRYQDSPYCLYDKNTHDKIETEIAIEYKGKESNNDNGLLKAVDINTNDLEYRYLPQLNLNGGLTPSNMYLTGLQYMPLVTLKSKDGKYIWKQPIIIIQNQYSSSMLNEWDGSFEIDEENGTIMSSMLGAGRKTTNNTFEGILMGELTKADLTYPMGLYGLHDGVPSFGFKIDGTAFLGKSGAGRIIFNGNIGCLGSSNWFTENANGSISVNANETEGMLIDLTNGFIDAYNFKLTSSNIFINSNPEEKNPYFQINGSNKPLIYMSNEQYYLQTNNYEENATGIKYDLGAGTISSKNFNVHSNGNVSLTGIITAEAGGSIGGWFIGEDYLHSKFVSGKYEERCVGISPGKYFNIYGEYANNPINDEQPLCFWAGATGRWRNNQQINWDVHPENSPFRVYKNGYLYASNVDIEGIINAKEGYIGGIIIDTNGIYSGIAKENPKYSNNYFRGTLNPNGSYGTASEMIVENYGETNSDIWYNYIFNEIKQDGIVRINGISGAVDIFCCKQIPNKNGNYIICSSYFRASSDTQINVKKDYYLIINSEKEISNISDIISIYFIADTKTSFELNKNGKFKASGVEIDGTGSFTGSITANNGYIANWVIGYDGFFGRSVIRSPGGFLGTIAATTTGTDIQKYTGYIYTVLSWDGMYYVIKSNESYSSGNTAVVHSSQATITPAIPQEPTPINEL